MKKIVYLLSALMLVFTACDPMEDVNAELDAIADGKKDEGLMVNKTLVAADYQFFKTSAPAVATRAAFASEDQALELLPAFVESKFPHLNEGAAVNITFNYTLYPSLSSAVSSNARLTVSNAEYTALGETGNRFDSEASDLAAYLLLKYPTPAERQLVAVTYKLPDPADNTKSITAKDSFLYLNGAWKNIYHVSDADYTTTGNGQFKNFDETNSNEVLLSYFDQFLTNYYRTNNLAAKVGDVQYVSYTYFAGSTNQKLATMIFNGKNWVDGPTWVESPEQKKSSTLKFKKIKNVWNVDLTVEYTLVNADYDWMGEGNTTPNYGTDKNRANIADKHSFWTQTQDDRFWTQEEIDKAILAFAKYKYPNPKQGVKFKINYKIYNGGTQYVYSLLEQDGNGGYTIIDRSK